MTKEIKKYEPTTKDVELFNEVCNIIANKGISVKFATDEVSGLSYKRFYEILNVSTICRNEYARACELRAYNMAERSCEIFDNIPATIIVNDKEEQNNIGLAIAKAKAENLKWYASKLNKALSDKADTNINIQNNAESVNVSLGSIDLSLKDDNM
jgi:hypothetical protein